jgi:hypothetical protein
MPNLDWYKKLYGVEYSTSTPDGSADKIHGGYARGRYYSSLSTVTTTAVAPNRVLFYPFPVFSQFTVERVSINVTTALAGNCVVGIYDDNAGAPSNLIAFSAQINTDTVGTRTALLNEQITLPTDIYWIATNFSSASSVTTSPNNHGLSPWIGSANFVVNNVGYRFDATFPALPPLVVYSTLVDAFSVPIVCLQSI